MIKKQTNKKCFSYLKCYEQLWHLWSLRTAHSKIKPKNSQTFTQDVKTDCFQCSSILLLNGLYPPKLDHCLESLVNLWIKAGSIYYHGKGMAHIQYWEVQQNLQEHQTVSYKSGTQRKLRKKNVFCLKKIFRNWRRSCENLKEL